MVKTYYINTTTNLPGKIIISGEHAVLYASKAISCTIDLYTYCNGWIECTDENVEGSIELNLRDLNIKYNIKVSVIENIKEKLIKNKINWVNLSLDQIPLIIKMISESFDNIELSKSHFIFLCAMLMIILEPKLIGFDFYLVLNSEIPTGAGLGSSAAYNVSLIDMIIKLFTYTGISNNIDSKDIIHNLSYFGEAFFHTKPSGIDTTVIINSGIYLFENIKNYWRIETDFFQNYQIYIIDTGIRRETKQFIEKVKNFKENYSKIFMNCIDTITYIVDEIKNCVMENSLIKEDRMKKFENLIKINQNVLNVMQVSNEQIDQIALDLLKIDIVSKLTGAGGGGFVLCFVREEKTNDFIKYVNNCNLDYKKISLFIEK